MNWLKENWSYIALVVVALLLVLDLMRPVCD